MAIGAFGTKRNDDVWLHSTEVVRNPRHRLSDVYLIQVAVVVVEESDLAHTTDDVRRRLFSAFAEAPTLTARGCHKIGLDPLAGVLCQRSSDAERFIIRVCQDTHQFQWPCLGRSHC